MLYKMTNYINILKILIFTIGLVFLLSSCASTKTTSYTDPDFTGKKYSKVCVYADVEDLESKQILERNIAESLQKQGIEAIKGADLFPPTRDWSDDQIQSKLLEKNADAYLLVKITDKSVKEEFHPGTSTSTTTGEVKKVKGKEIYKETTTTTNNSSTSRQFFSSFKTTLIDVKTNRIAWTATSQSESGEGFSSGFELIYESLANDLVEELTQKGHLTKK